MNKEKLQNAYAECLHMAQSHYENFPVASRLLPKHLRQRSQPTIWERLCNPARRC